MGQTYCRSLLGKGSLDLGLTLLDSSLDLRRLVSMRFKITPSQTRGNKQRPVATRAGQVKEVSGGVIRRRASIQQRRTFFTTLLSFLGAAVFFVTPVGFAPAFLAAGFLLIVGAVSTCWKTRGLELPVADRVPSRAIAIDFK